MKNETIMLDNLNCPSCAADLQKALLQLKGVSKADITFATGMLTIEYDEAAVEAANIEKTIQDFGATVATRM